MNLTISLSNRNHTVDLDATLIVSAETMELVTEAAAALHVACNGAGIAWRLDQPGDRDVVSLWGPLITLLHKRAIGAKEKDTPIIHFISDELLTAPEHQVLLMDLINATAGANAAIVYLTTQAPKYLPELSLGAPQQVLHYADEWSLDRF